MRTTMTKTGDERHIGRKQSKWCTIVQSTGFSFGEMWRQMAGEVSSWIRLVRFAMNVAHRWGDDLIQTRTVVESVQACNSSTVVRFVYESTTKRRSFEANTVQQNSRRGLRTAWEEKLLTFLLWNDNTLKSLSLHGNILPRLNLSQSCQRRHVIAEK